MSDVRGYTRDGIAVRSYARNRWGTWHGDDPARPRPAPAEVTPTPRLRDLLAQLARFARVAARCPSIPNISAVTDAMRRVSARLILDTAPQRQAGPCLGRTGGS